MLECDQCGEWFHFECVGLRSQGSASKEGGGNDAQNGGSTPDGDPVPENFSCPLCCMRSSTKYPFYHKLPQPSLDALKEAAPLMPPAPTPAPPTGMHPQAAAAAAAAAAQMAMYPQNAWPFAMAAAQRGMMPGMVNPQALASMMEASFPQGFVPGMMPGLVHPAMFGFAGMHPAMAQAMQQQAQAHQQAAVAQAQHQHQQQQVVVAAAAAQAAANAAAQATKTEAKAADGGDGKNTPRSGIQEGSPEGEDEIIEITKGGSKPTESELIDIEEPQGTKQGAKGEDAPIDII